MCDFKSLVGLPPKVNTLRGSHERRVRHFLGGTALVSILLVSSVYAQNSPAPSAASSPIYPQNSLLTPAEEKDLLNSLDLSLPALAPVQKAVAQANYITAQHELANYFRQRASPVWKFDPHHGVKTIELTTSGAINFEGKPTTIPVLKEDLTRMHKADPKLAVVVRTDGDLSIQHQQIGDIFIALQEAQVNPPIQYNQQTAADAVKGRVMGGHIPVWASFPDGKIDWLYNETDHQPGVARNGDWQGQLTRMDFWDAMAGAYLATGDEKYPKAWVQQLRSFIVQCPPPVEIPTIPSGWRPINVGCRMLASWPDAFYSFVLSPSVSDEDLLVCIYGFLLNGQYLSTHHGPGNGLLMERQGLYSIGCIFPEFKEAAQWRDQAIKGEIAQRAALFLPDGVECEVSTGYHNGAIENIMSLPKIAKLTGRLDEIPPDYIAPMEKAYEFEMYLMAPDRQLPMFADSWHLHVPGFLLQALPFFPKRQDFLWVGTDGKQGEPPAETSKAFDYAGLYAMRSSWDKDANYLAFKDGPYSSSHGHHDKLIVVMWAYGREILFNSGGGTYDTSIWRHYSIDTFSKNTVLVDGLPQRRPRILFTVNVPKLDSRWESTPAYDFVAGVYNEAYGDKGLHPATHVRRVLFLKPDLGIVADTLTPNDGASHTYQARWNLLTTRTQLIDSTHEVVSTDARHPNLSIVPLNPDGLDVRSGSGQLEPEMLGWNVLHTTITQPAAATTVLQTRKGAGVQTFLTLLVPIHQGVVGSVIRSVQEERPGSAEVTFTDGRKLHVIASADPAGTIEATETLADGAPGRHVIGGIAK